jgi:hypothetical protein
MLTELAECTVLMLKVIHEMYSKQRITYEEFIDYSETKLKFLKENIDYISSEIERRNVVDIIYEFNSLLPENAQKLVYLQ